MSLQKIAELNAKMAEARTEIAALAKSSGDEIIQELFAPLWEAGILGASWTQYTPYFADGDACEFGVSADEMPLQWPGLPELEGYESSASHISFYINNTDTRYNTGTQAAQYLALGLTSELVKSVDAICDAIAKVLHANEELLEAAYGDHAEITVTPNGVTVDHYDHD